MFAPHLDPQFVEYRGLDVHEAGAGMRQAVGGDGGWSHPMALYRDAA
ncbi:MAG TPA: hypothetical protein VFM57_06960 [Thermoleophilaceae bacterium]|nr:hypothetical protein [Thermoleophilaceae bacterium]